MPIDPDDCSIVLIGLRGCGKSAVGARLAEMLNRTFVDTDACIAAAAGQSIREIFQTRGEAGFRVLEALEVERACAQRGCVVSVGGGAVLDETSRARMRRAGVCIWLTAPPHELAKRIAADPMSPANRPALTRARPIEEIEQQSEERKLLFHATAHFVIPTDDAGVDEVANRVRRAFMTFTTGAPQP